jgi:hypothetical protein
MGVDGRHLPVRGAYNMRDLGGRLATGGRLVRLRLLLRADAHWPRVAPLAPVGGSFACAYPCDKECNASGWTGFFGCTNNVKICIIEFKLCTLPLCSAGLYAPVCQRVGKMVTSYC